MGTRFAPWERASRHGNALRASRKPLRGASRTSECQRVYRASPNEPTIVARAVTTAGIEGPARRYWPNVDFRS